MLISRFTTIVVLIKYWNPVLPLPASTNMVGGTPPCTPDAVIARAKLAQGAVIVHGAASDPEKHSTQEDEALTEMWEPSPLFT